MSAAAAFTLRKGERMASKRLIDKLFRGGDSHSLVSFPIRLVYLLDNRGDGDTTAQKQILISVPKRCFKRAVKRNRVKRQIREAYRRNKNFLPDLDEGRTLLMAFIWLDDQLHSSETVEKKVVKLLQRMSERL
ncbi:MAG: ribonuclease P protein component [Prevotella sp.]|nr:ribonuclease P protein component [Prevotella sp.]